MTPRLPFSVTAERLLCVAVRVACLQSVRGARVLSSMSKRGKNAEEEAVDGDQENGAGTIELCTHFYFSLSLSIFGFLCFY